MACARKQKNIRRLDAYFFLFLMTFAYQKNKQTNKKSQPTTKKAKL